MEGVTTFLESSTIHGLTYISTTRKYVKLFWILIVITGFFGAGYLINESFDSWSESPVKTNIETLPIEKIKFPKVTVCPPKNTFTDLNYDLLMTENMTLTKEMRDEMFKYAVEVIDEDSFSGNNWTKLYEKERFFNWYRGYTRINDPGAPLNGEHGLQIEIMTFAMSGIVSTQYYGEKFRPELVERKLRYMVDVYPPDSVVDDENVTLHIKLEKVSMKELTKESSDYMQMDLWRHEDDIYYENFTSPGEGLYFMDFKHIELYRDVSFEEVETQDLDLMPGFKFSWWYTGTDFTPGPNGLMHKHFVR